MSECQYAEDVGMPEYRCVGICQYANKPPMSACEIQAEAGRIIQIAMGKSTINRKRTRNADQDPLAYVIGVEAIVALIERASGHPTNPQALSE